MPGNSDALQREKHKNEHRPGPGEESTQIRAEVVGSTYVSVEGSLLTLRYSSITMAHRTDR